MPHLEKLALENCTDVLLRSSLTQHKASLLAYFFAASRIMQEQSATAIDISTTYREDLTRYCAEFIEIDAEENLIWTPFEAKYNDSKSQPYWYKGKSLAQVVYSNLLSTAVADRQASYPKSGGLLSFATGRCELHPDYKQNFEALMADKLDDLLAIVLLSLRTHDFNGSAVSLGDLLVEHENVFGKAGKVAADLIRASGRDLTITVATQSNVTSLQELLIPHVPHGDRSASSTPAVSPTSVGLPPTIDQSDYGVLLSQESLPLNLLIKGVPGTGKSFLIDNIIKSHLKLDLSSNNVKRINVHSASDNTSFMQGVGVAVTKEEKVIYKEKFGGVLMHLLEAIRHPKQPYVLVLEEIQENSLNELIGDLIYLIEPNKRVDVRQHLPAISAALGDEGLVDVLETLARQKDVQSVQLPPLIEEGHGLRLVFPHNLYVFCTTNYRDDKKIIEDNLMRRFDVIDLFPDTDGKLFFDNSVREFLETFNDSVLQVLGDVEPHPDRFLVGHARFMSSTVKDKPSFYKALKKIVDEFKEIRDVEFDSFSPILKGAKLKGVSFITDADADLIIACKNYKELVDLIQKQCGYVFSSDI